MRWPLKGGRSAPPGTQKALDAPEHRPGVRRLQPARTPARPGPGPTPPAVLRALDLTIGRRIEGLLAGDHRAAHSGPGTELAQVRQYEPGDDVRLIDWNVTARTLIPHVRVQVAERAVTTWLVLDVSPSMQFGTVNRRKADVAEGVALALGHLTTRRGNRLGVMTFGERKWLTLPPRQGQRALLSTLAAVRREPEPEGTGATSLGEVLRRAGRLVRQRTLVVVVSDFRGPRDWRRALVQLTGRHEVLAIEIQDPREGELPDIGEVCFLDPETQRTLRVDTSSRRLRERFAAAAAEERHDLARVVRSAGARHLTLSTSSDWLRPLASFLDRSPRRGARAGRPRQLPPHLPASLTPSLISPSAPSIASASISMRARVRTSAPGHPGGSP